MESGIRFAGCVPFKIIPITLGAKKARWMMLVTWTVVTPSAFAMAPSEVVLPDVNCSNQSYALRIEAINHWSRACPTV
jgi:hypothetical protein